MTTLAKFQKRTVQVALDRLEADGPRRFLVADEVGLGKTVIARSVAEGLRRNRRRLNVMYLCPSLEIVGQNRLKFVSLDGSAIQSGQRGLLWGDTNYDGAGGAYVGICRMDITSTVFFGAVNYGLLDQLDPQLLGDQGHRPVQLRGEAARDAAGPVGDFDLISHQEASLSAPVGW